MTDDVYLTIDSIPDQGGGWTFGVVVQPLVMWLWVGGVLIVVGSVLSAVPGGAGAAHRPGVGPGGAACPAGRRPPTPRDRWPDADRTARPDGDADDAAGRGAGDAS